MTIYPVKFTFEIIVWHSEGFVRRYISCLFFRFFLSFFSVKSKQNHPVVDVCGSNLASCYTQSDNTSAINCFIRGIRPAVTLQWFVRTAEGDRKILFATNVTSDGFTYTLCVTTTNVFQYSLLLSLLVCKAESPPGMMLKDETFVLIENTDIASNSNPIQTRVESGSLLRLLCSEAKPDIIVWKRWDKHSDSFVILSYIARFHGNFSRTNSKVYKVDPEGLLIVPDVHLNHSGIYQCSFENGITRGKSLYDVVVYAPSVNDPQPAVKRRLLWLLVIPMCLLPAVILYIYCRQHRSRLDTEGTDSESIHNQEDVPLRSSQEDGTLPGPNLETLKKELKEMYKIKYGSVQPIAASSTKWRVASIFVDCGYKLMTVEADGRDLDFGEDIRKYTEVLQRIDIPSVAVIEGGPGYGKSMLTLQLAYDWCNGIESSQMHDKDILILLKLRDVRGVQSVYEAIKKQIVSRDCSLSEKDIRNSLRECNSGVLILDGYDEYPDLRTDSKSHIMSIVRGEMFQRYLVLITTRSFSLLKSLPPKSYRIKLAGFDEEARDQYIRNVVAECDRRKEEKIRRCLHNVSVTDLLKIPLLFTASAHVSVEEGGFKNFRSLSSIIKFMINCLHSHMEKKMLNQDSETVKSYKQEHRELDDIAFQIVSEQHKPTWRKDKICQQVSGKFYGYYKRVGILVENVSVNYGTLRSITKVQFFHELFCEWYAAHSLIKKCEESELGFREIEESTQLFKLRTVYLFACGINADFANKIVKYLVDKNVSEIFACLCYFESERKIDKIFKEVKDFAASEVILDSNQDILLSWSAIHLLAVASRNEIPITCLQLKAYKSQVEFSNGALHLQAKIYLPYLTTLEQLVIHEFVDMQATDETSILKYSSMCEKIKALKFYHCNVAKTIQDTCLTSLKSRNVSVEWKTLSSVFYMNLQSGLWEREGIPLTEEEYFKEIEDIRHHLGGGPSTSRDGEG